MGRKEMEAVGMVYLFADRLLQCFLISLRNSNIINVTKRLCTCVLYHCLHPRGTPHFPPPSLSPGSPAFFLFFAEPSFSLALCWLAHTLTPLSP